MAGNTTGLTVEVQNLAAFARVMRGGADSELPRRVRNINMRGAMMVAEQARSWAPRRTGKLAGSIRISASPTMASVRLGGTGVPYANAIHWGWTRPDTSGVSHNIRKNPFLFNAAKRRRPDVLAMYELDMMEFVASINGRL